MRVLIDLAAWSIASNGDQARTLSSKLIAAIQCFHQVDVGIELPTRSPLIKKALQELSRSRAASVITAIEKASCLRNSVALDPNAWR